jgi:hypothetical protein
MTNNDYELRYGLQLDRFKSWSREVDGTSV